MKKNKKKNEQVVAWLKHWPLIVVCVLGLGLLVLVIMELFKMRLF